MSTITDNFDDNGAPPSPSLIENRIDKAIEPYFKLERVIADLGKGLEKARAPAIRALKEILKWLTE